MEIRRTVYTLTSSSITSLHGGKYKPFYTIKHLLQAKKARLTVCLRAFILIICQLYLPVLVHLVVVALVVSGCDIVHPLLVLQIPSHRLLDTLLELKARLPTELPLQFPRVWIITLIRSMFFHSLNPPILYVSATLPSWKIRSIALAWSST